MSYSLEILKRAQRQLAKIARDDRARIIQAIEALVDDPRPAG